MTNQTPPGWYPDTNGTIRRWDGDRWTDDVRPPDASRPAPPSPAPSRPAPAAPAPTNAAPTRGGIGGMIDQFNAAANEGAQPRSATTGMSYVVLQVVLKEKFLGTGSGNLTELEQVINRQAALGYRLHTISTTSSGSKGFGGGDRVQATMVFEKLT